MEDFSRGDYRRDLREGSWVARHTFWSVVLFIVFVVAILFVVRLVFLPAALVEKATDPNHIISNYEEYQNIYNTCQKINTDLGTIRDIPDSDPSFAQFSKAQQIAAKKQQLSRWVEEYNAKSKMINRNMWKSTSLPHQLHVNDFSRFEQ